jgi:hypothetical protein
MPIDPLVARVLQRREEIMQNVIALGAVCTVLTEAETKLRELHDFCEGCDCPSTRCGPELWRQQRKCCPDCIHGRRGNGC